MEQHKLKGLMQVDGTKDGFNIEELKPDTVYFVRTDTDKKKGYLYLNGKKYGTPEKIINCGEY